MSQDSNDDTQNYEYSVRVRKDGVREMKVHDTILVIPHDHEIAPAALAPEAVRQEFWVVHCYDCVNWRDKCYARATSLLASARDLEAMKAWVPTNIGLLLMEAASLARDAAVVAVGADTVSMLNGCLDRQVALQSEVRPSVGPQYEDDQFLKGVYSDDSIDVGYFAELGDYEHAENGRS